MPDLIDPLRPARRDDAATIAAYHRRCWQTSFRSITDLEVLAYVEQSSMDDLIALWHQRMADDSPQRVVVATDSSDQAIGHVMVDGAELVHLFIDPDHHREGWGRVLLEIGEAMIRENGHRVAELHTMVGNTPAITLYEATGWVVTDDHITNELPNGSSFVEHVLRKDLGDTPTR